MNVYYIKTRNYIILVQIIWDKIRILQLGEVNTLNLTRIKNHP